MRNIKEKLKEKIVFVNRPGGITIDGCTDIYKKLSVHFETIDILPRPYKLEVSSPGAKNKEER